MSHYESLSSLLIKVAVIDTRITGTMRALKYHYLSREERDGFEEMLVKHRAERELLREVMRVFDL